MFRVAMIFFGIFALVLCLVALVLNLIVGHYVMAIAMVLCCISNLVSLNFWVNRRF